MSDAGGAALTLAQAGGIGLAAIVVAATLVWTVSVRRRDASIADIFWGPGFAMLAWLYCWLFDAIDARPVALAVMVTVWAARLAVHISRRHRGEDPRYAAMRTRRGPAFWWQSLFVVFWLQAALLWVVALPLLGAARAPGPPMPTATDVAGFVLFVIGLAFETIGDYQLTRFRANPNNRARVLETGLWRYTRHPNYFGDALLWWGLFLVAASVPGAWWTFAGPALMTFLLVRVSGVTLLEQSLKTSRPGYEAYVRRTPAFVPWFPRE